MLWLALLCTALTVAVSALILKIVIMQKSLREICEQVEGVIAQSSNRALTVSSADRHVRALATELNRSLEKLCRIRCGFEKGDRELKDAVCNISHDLRTPLTAIYGYLDLLAREETSEDVRRYLSQIQNRAEAMSALTEELFRYSVLSEQETLCCEEVDLCRVLEESLLAFYGVMKQKGVEPQISMPTCVVVRRLDARAVSRVLENVLSNAVRYSEGRIAVQLSESGEITVSNRTGALSKVETERLFDRFYTVDSAHKTTGLGLSIAKLLTERMGGVICADYEEGILYIRIRFAQ